MQRLPAMKFFFCWKRNKDTQVAIASKQCTLLQGKQTKIVLNEGEETTSSSNIFHFEIVLGMNEYMYELVRGKWLVQRYRRGS